MTATQLGGGAERLEYTYDNTGRVSTTDATDVTRSTYFDHRGLVVRTEDGLGDYTRLEFNNQRQLVRQTDSLGRAASFTWSAAGELKTVKDPFGNTTTFVGGGPNEQPTAFVDAAGNTVQYTYDAVGNLTSTEYADSTVERVTYDALGNSESVVNRRNQAITQSYNAAGQVTQQNFPDGSTATFTYAAAGQLETSTDAGGTTTFSYDTADRLTRIDYPNGRWLEYAYDTAGRRTQMEDHSGFVVQYGYDTAGRLSNLRDGADTLLVSYGYDDAGRLNREDKGNGTYTLTTYDEAGRVESIVHHAPDDSVNSQFVYRYDSIGQRIGISTIDGVWTYEYDLTGQLVHAVFAATNAAIANQDLSYEYDAVGNRVRTVAGGETTDYAANSLNQYTTSGDIQFRYDLDGNLIEESGPDGTKRFTYNERNQLVKVTTQDGIWQYEYDVFGNRTAVVRDGERTEFLLDPTGLVNVLGEYDDAGLRTVSYVHGLGLESAANATGVNYYDFSAIGSTSGISGTSGDYVNKYAYEPFGESLQSIEGIENSFEFVGEFGVRAEGNGLSFMRARYYDPQQGRFVAQDPIRLEGGTNFYAYAENDSIELIDPAGENGSAGLVVTGAFGVLSGCFLNRGGHLIGSPNLSAVISVGTLGQCKPLPPRLPLPLPAAGGGTGAGGSAGTAFSVDPNEKFGASGYGPQEFVRAETTIPYRINFENLGPGTVPTPAQPATAPAQRVEVTDQLSDQLDWSTLEFTAAGFGDELIDVPAGSQYHFAVVPMNFNDQTFDVEVELSFDPASGRVRAVFQSVDPDTFLPPDVLTGFLPPEDGTGRGKGTISFTINAAEICPRAPSCVTSP